MTIHYWPYDEVSLQLPNDDTTVTLETPWLTATLEKSFFDRDVLRQLKSKLDEKTLGVEDLPLVNHFFSHFHQYPVAYVLPTEKFGDEYDTHELDDNALVHMDFLQLFNVMFSGFFSKSDVAALRLLLPRREFHWDVDAAVAFSSFNGRVHPESLLSVVRRYHLIELLTNDHGHEIFRAIEKLDAHQFKKAVAQMVRQNHFVTEQCQQALSPARDRAGRAEPLVQAFMDEEFGHDRLLKKSLLQLGMQPEEIPVSIRTRALMHGLSYCAQTHFLAFSFAIDAFERSAFADVDPLADLLIKGGFKSAAKYINAHMNINDQGEHENVAAKFLTHMESTSPQYATVAVRMMEIISLIMCGVSGD